MMKQQSESPWIIESHVEVTKRLWARAIFRRHSKWVINKSERALYFCYVKNSH